MNPSPAHIARFRTLITVLYSLLILGAPVLHAQEMPPRPISVGLGQNLSFGAFATGTSGGSITVTASGIRSSTGTIIQMGQLSFAHEAIFEIDANVGYLISVVLGSDVVMNGSNGGTMSLHLADIYPPSPIVTTANPPAVTYVHIGGVLTVGNQISNPPGDYSGYFNVMFIQE
jgi:hypothetical protein